MALFEWGVATHDLDFEAIRSGEEPKEKVVEELKGMSVKARHQIIKDYIAWPLISAGIAAGATWAVASVSESRRSRRERAGRKLASAWRRARRRPPEPTPGARARDTALRTYKATAGADATANVIRNVWSHAIIF